MSKITRDIRELYRMPMLIIHELFHCAFIFILFGKLPILTIKRDENGEFYGHCLFITSKKRYWISCLSPVLINVIILISFFNSPWILLLALLYSASVYKYSVPSKRDIMLAKIYLKGEKSIQDFFESMEKDVELQMQQDNVKTFEISPVEL